MKNWMYDKSKMPSYVPNGKWRVEVLIYDPEKLLVGLEVVARTDGGGLVG